MPIIHRNFRWFVHHWFDRGGDCLDRSGRRVLLLQGQGGHQRPRQRHQHQDEEEGGRDPGPQSGHLQLLGNKAYSRSNRYRPVVLKF